MPAFSIAQVCLQNQVSLDTIPQELRSRQQWVCWRMENKEGVSKLTKVPYDPRTGMKASTTDSSTWCSFDHAAGAFAYLRNKGDTCSSTIFATTSDYSGIGYVFSVDDPFTGVDLDGAYEAPGCLYPWAESIVSSLDSYTERSPSGTGVHVIVRARLGQGRRRCGSVETYDRGRYFTMTGACLTGVPAEVREAQGAVDDLVAHLGPSRPAATVPVWGHAQYDGDLRTRAAAGPIRRVTLALLDSTGPDAYESASEADAGLAAGLAHAGLTADEILSLIEGSARGYDGFRRKGNTHGLYYWRRTIEHAVRLVGPVLVVDNRRVQMAAAR